MAREPRKTILFVESTHVWIGGVATRQERLAALLPQRGWRPIFALTRGNRFHDPFAYRRAHPDIESVLLDGRTGTPEGRRLAVRRAIRSVSPAVFNPGAMLDAFEAMREAKFSGETARLICGLVAVTAPGIAALRRYAPILDGAFAVSRRTRDLLAEVCGVPEERLRLVPTGVPEAHAIRMPKTPGRIRLAYAGRLDPDKRPLDLVGLAAELERRRVDFGLTVVGGGTSAGALSSVASGLIESGRLRMRPKMSSAELYEDVYPNCDAVLLFSPSEGFPNALLEGMTHGAVPVTSAFEGIAEEGFFRDGQNACVFPVGDVPKAANAIERLAKDDAFYGRLSERALASASRRTLSTMADEFVSLLDRTMELPPLRGAVPPIGEGPSGRLSRWFGPRMAESIRRIVGRRYPHPDASEWPLIDNGRWPDSGEVASLLAARAGNAVPLPESGERFEERREVVT